MASQDENAVELKNLIGFSDLTEEPLLSFAPIQTYEHLPLVTLEETIEPLISIVPCIKQMVSIVKENTREIKDGLTLDESGAIMLYSMSWEPKEYIFSLILNRTLRDEDRNKLRPWLLYLKLFMTSLSKLQSLHCFVYRGAPTDLSDEYPQGKAFIWCGFSLCTRSIEIFESQQCSNKTNQRTRLKIECKSAKDICNHSFSKRSDEVLLLPARRYKVMSSLDADNGLRIIQIKEIDPFAVLSFANSDRTASLSLSLSQRTPSISLSIREASFCSVVLKLTGSSTRSHRNTHLEDLITLCKLNSCIDLSVRELTDRDIPVIVQRAIIDKKCRALYLTGNKISSRSISILTDALYHNSTLLELDLSDNSISDAGVQMLADVLKTNTSVLKRLHLGSNRISDKGILFLSDMLKTNRTLTHLMLNRNHISDSGVHQLSNSIAVHNNSLETLSLSFNSFITDSSINSLITMLKCNRTLKELDVKYCNITEINNRRLRQVANDKPDFTLHANADNRNGCFLS